MNTDERAALVKRLHEEVARYGVECSETKELAPRTSLVAVFKEIEAALTAQDGQAVVEQREELPACPFEDLPVRWHVPADYEEAVEMLRRARRVIETKSAAEPQGVVVPMAQCPVCLREWPKGCEQDRCIQAHAECIPCHFGPNGKGTSEEFNAMFPMLAAAQQPDAKDK